MLLVLGSVAMFVGIGAFSRRVGWPQTTLIAATAIALALAQLTLPRFL